MHGNLLALLVCTVRLVNGLSSIDFTNGVGMPLVMNVWLLTCLSGTALLC